MKTRCISVLVLLVLACVGPLYGQSLSLDPTVTYTPTYGEVLAVSYDILYKAFPQISSDGRGEVWLTRSFDGGQTWEDPRRIYQSSVPQVFVRSLAIAAVEENVYVAWLPCCFTSSASVMVSNDYGDTFELRRNGLGVESDSNSDLLLSASGSDIFVVWQECDRISGGVCARPRRHNIYLAFSPDAGRTFDAATLASDVSDVVSLLRLFSSWDDVYVQWRAGTQTYLRHAQIVRK